MYKLNELDKFNIKNLLSLRGSGLSNDELKEGIEIFLSMDNNELAHSLNKILHIWEKDYFSGIIGKEKKLFDYCDKLVERLIENIGSENEKIGEINDIKIDKKIIPPEIIVSINNIKEIMVKNVTWKTDISNLLEPYNLEYRKINTWCIENGLLHKNKFVDLWNFYNYWRDNNNNLNTYALRRKYIYSLYDDFSSGIISNSIININELSNIHPKIYSHIQKLFNDGHYFNAVEESYKITRQKLFELTGKEKANEAFKNGYEEVIFGKNPENDVERDFFEGVKNLHFSIQRFRNEKAHTPAKELDKNRAIHYIYLASLALYLIDYNKNN